PWPAASISAPRSTRCWTATTRATPSSDGAVVPPAVRRAARCSVRAAPPGPSAHQPALPRGPAAPVGQAPAHQALQPGGARQGGGVVRRAGPEHEEGGGVRPRLLGDDLPAAHEG